MKVGAEPRKVAILGVLLVVAAYLIYSNILSPDAGIPEEARGASAAPAPPPAATAPPPVPATAAATSAAPAPRPNATRRFLRGTSSQEWTPTLKPRRPEDQPDPTRVDPSLRLDLLARLKQVTYSGGERSLFDFSQPPKPPVKEPIIKPKPAADLKPEAPPSEPPKDVEPPKPPPPPIPLKFYGFVTGGGPRRAFFLQGEEIFVAAEGELLQKRYKIVRIGLSSAVVEDTQHKNQQTLQLEAQPG